MATVYANVSKTRDAGTGGSWYNYNSGTDGIYWVGAGGIFNNTNEYAWFGFPHGFADPNVYEITGAVLFIEQTYLSYQYREATDNIHFQCGTLNPTGTNGISNVIYTKTVRSLADTDRYTYAFTDFIYAAQAIQKGTADGVLITIDYNHLIHPEFAAHVNSADLRARIEYTTKLRDFYCIPHTTDSSKGAASGGGTASYGNTLTITAHPNIGYHFVRWQTANGSGYSTQNPLTLTANVNLPTDLYAVFEINTYSVGVSSLGNGSVSGGGTYSYGSTCTARATPNTGYHFVRWQNSSGSGISTANPYSFTVTSAVNIYASFAVNQYTISASAIGDGGSSSVSGGGTYNYGSTATVVAHPATGFRFVKWTTTNSVDGSAVSTNASYSFTVTGARTLYAVFERQRYNVSISAQSGRGTVSGGGSYSYNSSCTVRATPNAGYKFKHWTNANGNIISTNNPYTFFVTSEVTLIAVFENDSAIHVLNESTGNYDLYLPYVLTDEGNYVLCETYVNIDGEWKLCIS